MSILSGWRLDLSALTPRSSSPPNNRVDEVVQKMKEAEKALQQAREALNSYAELERSGASGANTPRSTAPSEELNRGSSSASIANMGTTDLDREAKHLSQKEKNKCMRIFQAADKDKSGLVSAMELRKMLEKAEVPVPSAMFDDMKQRIRMADGDRDGRLNFQEFCRAFCYGKHSAEADRKSAMRDLQRDALQSQEENMPTEQYVRVYGVQVSTVTRYLRKELDEASACQQLPQAFAVFICFFLSVTWHFDYPRLHGVDKAITWDIKENANFAFSGILPFENGRMGHKNVDDVNTIPDFWSWMNLGLVPLFWQGGFDRNEARLNVLAKCYSPLEVMGGWGGYNGVLNENYSDTGSPDYGGQCPEKFDQVFPQDTLEFFSDSRSRWPEVEGTYLFYHRIVGGVRLRQERTPLVSCPNRVEELRGSVFRGKCVRSKEYWLRPEMHDALRIDKSLVNLPGGETVHLLSLWAQDQVRDNLKKLEDRFWFSPQTSKIEILFPTYNVNEDLITATYIVFFLNRGGHIHKLVEPVSFPVDHYNSGYGVWIADIAWAAFCLKLFLDESWEIVKHWRQLGFRKGSWVYMSLANVVDWMSIGMAIFIVIYWFVHLHSVAELRDSLLMARAGDEGSFKTAAERDEFFDRIDNIVEDVHNLRTILAIYPFVIVSRFFKAFSLQPRLAMVTRTLAKAGVDITHFLVVFGTVFFIFGFSAMVLWGQEVADFANETRSVHTLFRILLGDFDWEQLNNVGRPQAYLWFWTFIWLVNMVLLNMLLAIIMDVYTDVKAGIGTGAETLWSQSLEIYRRWRSVITGRSVSLGKVLHTLDATDLDTEDEDEEAEAEMLYPSTLVEKVEGMKEEQALQVLVEAQKLKVADERIGATLTDAMGRISKIDQRTLVMAEQLSRFIQVQPLQSHQVNRHAG